MVVHIGKKVREVLKESGISVTDFAKKLNYSRRNIYAIFERQSIDIELIIKIGDVLHHDFLQYFVNRKNYLTREEKQLLEEENTQVRYLQDQLAKNKKTIASLQKEVSYLQEINEFLKEKLERLEN